VKVQCGGGCPGVKRERQAWGWMSGSEEGKASVGVGELDQATVEERMDRSRSNESAAGATQTRGKYLGKLATVADA